MIVATLFSVSSECYLHVRVTQFLEEFGESRVSHTKLNKSRECTSTESK